MHKPILFLLTLFAVSIADAMQQNNAMIQVPRKHYEQIMSLLEKLHDNAQLDNPPIYREVEVRYYQSPTSSSNICRRCNVNLGIRTPKSCPQCSVTSLFLNSKDIDAIDRLKQESSRILEEQKHKESCTRNLTP